MDLKTAAEKGLRSFEWTNDCQGKKDFDGEVLHVSSRYWPRGGGFHVLDENGWSGNEARPEIRPSAVSHIYFFDKELVTKQFEADTEEEVKALVETWVKEQIASLTEHLSRWAQP